MTRAEQLRIATVFVGFGVVVLVLFGRLVDLHLIRGEDVVAAALRQQVRTEVLPAPRGTIVDRNGEVLAADRPIYEVRAEIKLLPASTEDLSADASVAAWRANLSSAVNRSVSEIVAALTADPERPYASVEVDALRASLLGRVERSFERHLERGRARHSTFHCDILIDRQLDSYAALEMLRGLDSRRMRRSASEERGYFLWLHLTRRFQRVYPEAELLTGLVGTVVEPVRPPGSPVLKPHEDPRVGQSGLERLRVLAPRKPGSRELRVSASGRPFYEGSQEPAGPPAVLRTTIDVELARRADAELVSAVAKVTARYETPPEWGSLVLVDVETGAVLAAASYATGKDGARDPNGAFAPTKRLFEPGSIVKPIHIALGLDRGTLSWDEKIDCSAGRGRLKFANAVRTIRDEHKYGMLTPRGVIVKSSNIGAVRLGLRLGAEGLEDYLRFARFGEPTAVRLPNERSARRPPEMTGLNGAELGVWTGPSICFGYQVQVTPLQVARMFLSMLSRRARELRLIEGFEADGGFQPYRPKHELDPEYFVRQQTLDTVTEAMVGVVHEGTAEKALSELRGRRLERGDVAGKTGTSQYRGHAVRWDGKAVHGDIRTASFVGFGPAIQPRYLVVCVVQKVGAARFFGGSYAAPAAIRLLLDAMARD